MKLSVVRHVENLDCMLAILKTRQAEVARAQWSVAVLEADIATLTAQLDRAWREGRDSFDADRFPVAKVPHAGTV